jgi:hypothetical protein
MAITRLKRKGKRNKVRAKVRLVNIQRLNATPVIKSVDVEAIKEEFAKAAKKPETKKEAPKAEAEVAEKAAPKAEKEAKAPKAEKKEAPKAEKKKAAPKKKAEDK